MAICCCSIAYSVYIYRMKGAFDFPAFILDKVNAANHIVCFSHFHAYSPSTAARDNTILFVCISYRLGSSNCVSVCIVSNIIAIVIRFTVASAAKALIPIFFLRFFFISLTFYENNVGSRKKNRCSRKNNQIKYVALPSMLAVLFEIVFKIITYWVSAIFEENQPLKGLSLWIKALFITQ